MSDARHHRAVQVIFVETPAAGCPKEGRRNPPPAYPHQRREAWKPAQAIPRDSKAAATKRWLDAMWRNDAAARSFMDEARRASLLQGDRHAG